MRNVLAGRLAALLLVSFMAVTPPAARAQSAPEPGSACPDLSGSWLYPGRGGLDAACSPRWPARLDMPLPGPGGYSISAISPHRLTLDQDGCRGLVMETRRGLSLGNEKDVAPDLPKTLVFDLTPGRGRKVVWRDRSLSWRRKYTPAGFRLPPWRKEWMELRLQVLPDGRLEYHLQQEHGGEVLAEITCRLERWAGE